MASAQQQRRENKTNEREVRVDEHKVNKLASQFEALAEQNQGGDTTTISTTTTTTTTGRPSAAPIVEEAHKVLRRTEPKDTKAVTQQSRAHHEKGDQAHFESISDKVTGDRGTGTRSSGTGMEASPTAGQQKQRVDRSMEALTQGKTGEAQKHGFSTEGYQQGKTGETQQLGHSTEGLGQGKTGETQRHGISTYGGTGETQERTGKTQKQGVSTQGRTGEAQKQGSTDEVGKFQVNNEGDTTNQEGNKDQESRVTPSLEDISEYRQTAQQNSLDSIRAAEERYSKAKNLACTAAHEAKESAYHGIGAAATYAAHLGSKAKDQTLGGIQYMSEKAAPAKDTAVETAQRGYVSTKGTVAGAGQTAADYSATAAQKAGETGKTVAGKAVETGKTVGAKAVETGKTVGAKAVETGKTVGEKAVETAAEVKDRAVVAGWGTAEYAGELAVGATKAAAGLVKGVAGYTADTAAVAKDVVADVGRKTGGYVEEKAVAAGETVTDYAAKKREKARQELEAKKRQGQAPLSSVTAGVQKSGGGGVFSSEQSTTTTPSEQHGGMMETMVEEGGGVLGAIGETIAEIAQGVVAPPPASAFVDPTLQAQDKSGTCDAKDSKNRSV